MTRHVHPGSEHDLLDQVVQLAQLTGWRVHHCRPARTTTGWATPIQGDAGFPDLVLAHPTRGVLFVELKRPGGRLTPAQQAWLACLRAPGATVRVWRPGDWAAIQHVLTGRKEER